MNSFLFLTASLGLRGVEAGHGPFSSMYEFSLAVAWGSLLIHLYFEIRYRLRALAFFTLPVALGLLIYATFGGLALAARVRAEGDWRQFTLYRAAPRDGQFRVSFALTGLGEAWLDEVSVSILDKPARGMTTDSSTRAPRVTSRP